MREVVLGTERKECLVSGSPISFSAFYNMQANIKTLCSKNNYLFIFFGCTCDMQIFLGQGLNHNGLGTSACHRNKATAVTMLDLLGHQGTPQVFLKKRYESISKNRMAYTDTWLPTRQVRRGQNSMRSK